MDFLFLGLNKKGLGGDVYDLKVKDGESDEKGCI